MPINTTWHTRNLNKGSAFYMVRRIPPPTNIMPENRMQGYKKRRKTCLNVRGLYQYPEIIVNRGMEKVMINIQ